MVTVVAVTVVAVTVAAVTGAAAEVAAAGMAMAAVTWVAAVVVRALAATVEDLGEEGRAQKTTVAVMAEAERVVAATAAEGTGWRGGWGGGSSVGGGGLVGVESAAGPRDWRGGQVVELGPNRLEATLEVVEATYMTVPGTWVKHANAAVAGRRHGTLMSWQAASW